MEQNKPNASMIGSDGNIFNQVAIAAKVLKDEGLRDKAKEMSERVFRAGSYDEALSIIQEYVNPADKGEYNKSNSKSDRSYER